MNNCKLALGAVQYYWPRDTLLQFYQRLADTPVDIIYLGETVCAKRKLMHTSDWLALARELKAAGKQVVLSTLTLLEADSDLKTLKTVCDNGEFMVEANDFAAIHLLRGKPFVTGTAINIYNAHSLKKLADLGLKRWVLPLELSADSLATIQAERPAGIETEVFAYGRLPLAYSARCFTARAHDTTKDACAYRCLDYPDGLPLATQENSPFLVLNGIQTQSAHSINLLPYLEELQQLKVDVLRLSPQSHHMNTIITTFHQCLQGKQSVLAGVATVQPLIIGGGCDGYWRGTAGMM
jgi:collagenase-like PrtC family protease